MTDKKTGKYLPKNLKTSLSSCIVTENDDLILRRYSVLASAFDKGVKQINTTDLGRIRQIAPDLSRQRFSPELEISLYRILQEALTNIIKHAQATEVQINLSIKKFINIASMLVWAYME